GPVLRGLLHRGWPCRRGVRSVGTYLPENPAVWAAQQALTIWPLCVRLSTAEGPNLANDLINKNNYDERDMLGKGGLLSLSHSHCTNSSLSLSLSLSHTHTHTHTHTHCTNSKH